MNPNHEFRTMLLRISEQLDESHMKDLKFLLVPTIGRRKLEKISTGIDIFDCLIGGGELAPGNTTFLRDLLNKIHKTALVDLIDNYEKIESPAGETDAEEREKICIATDVMVQHLGRKWLRVARKLELNNTQIEDIQAKHSQDLEEQVRAMVAKWMKVQRDKASVKMLLKALRDNDFNLAADLIEKDIFEKFGTSN